MCRSELIKPGTPVDDESIIGDECHIVSAVAGGPRYDPDFLHESADRYANLLLLCKVHHKLIDGDLGLQEVSDMIRASRFLDEHIRVLEQAGVWVFGCRERRILDGGAGPEIDWPVAHIQVLRNTNPDIIALGLDPEGS